MIKIIYICENTIHGIFSALYDAWKESRDLEAGIALKGQVEHKLFCEYKDVKTDELKVLKMDHFLKKHLGYQAYHDMYHALLSNDSYKAEAVFKVMQAAREVRNSSKIMEHLSNSDVMKVFELSRKVANEAHLFTGFVRFRELENGILFSEIAPNNQILTCISDYFTNRFPLEDWVIYDKTNEIFLVHPKGMDSFLMTGYELDLDFAEKVSQEEEQIVELWKGFFTSISITERESKKRQRGCLPLRYRTHMTEFS